MNTKKILAFLGTFTLGFFAGLLAGFIASCDECDDDFDEVCTNEFDKISDEDYDD